jgi:hypothetical protein
VAIFDIVNLFGKILQSLNLDGLEFISHYYAILQELDISKSSVTDNGHVSLASKTSYGVQILSPFGFIQITYGRPYLYSG